MLKVLDKNCEPSRGSKHSACVDLRAREDIAIKAGETVLIPLGVCIDKVELDEIIINDFKSYGKLTNWGAVFDDKAKKEKDKIIEKFLSSHYIQLMLRSSLSKELIIANGVGIIDLDYKDEIMIRVHKPIKIKKGDREKERHIQTLETLYIKAGDRVAQITLLEHKTDLFGVHTDDERVGGFGSTGKK